ncbi:hypothetical protein BDZ45DRAFT_699494 [Acephala macrosclerotiorum]|nr:hypothetical protein BDZ45DRAFT_699494 [Acephala macrosclerotiorum]
MARARACSDESGFRQKDSGSRRDVEGVLRGDVWERGGDMMYFVVVVAEKANGDVSRLQGRRVEFGALVSRSRKGLSSFPLPQMQISGSIEVRLQPSVTRTRVENSDSGKIGGFALAAHQLRLVPRVTWNSSSRANAKAQAVECGMCRTGDRQGCATDNVRDKKQATSS